MSISMYMGFKESVRGIATKFVQLVPAAQFQHRLFPYPGWNTVNYSPDKPSIICRWDGIAEDRATENVNIVIPSAYRFELRILSISSYGPPGVTDPYAHAQTQVLDGTDLFFEALSANRDLDGLVLDAGVEASIIGDLIDPTTEEEFYGHEMVIVTRNYR